MNMQSDNSIPFTVWARATIESDVFVYKPAEWFKIWFFLVSRAFWHDGKTLKRGEILLTLAEISASTRTTRDQVDKCLRWARGERMISVTKTTRGMRIFIVNYAKYQDITSTKKRQESDRKATAERHESDTIEEPLEPVTIKPRLQYEGSEPSAPTPRDEAKKFFNSPEIRQPIIEWMVSEKGVDQTLASKEIEKFVLYWTEPTHSGKAQRWEKESAFEIRRRLVTWISRAAKDSRSFGKTGVQWSSI